MFLRPTGTNHGLLLLNAGALAVALAMSGGGTVPDGLTLQLAARYVDYDGNRQVAVADNTTIPTIYGVAPFQVWFDGTASVSVATTANTPGKAILGLNSRFNSGEGLGGTWSLTGGARDILEGPGAYNCHVFTTPGTHRVASTRVDYEGRQGTIYMDVVVVAPTVNVVDVAEGGSWPALSNHMVIRLAAGSDHTSKGALNLNGYNDIKVVKHGVGADPIVTAINFDTRNIVHTATTRTRNCSIDGINAGSIGESSIGPLHCTVLNLSNPFIYNTSGLAWDWQVNLDNSDITARNNMAYTRGLAFWNCTGGMESRGDFYVYITQARDVCVRNTRLLKDLGNSGQHVLRGDYHGLDLAHSLLLASADASSAIKLTGFENDDEPDEWDEEFDRYGVASTGVLYKPLAQKLMVKHNIIGAPGADNFTGLVCEALPENDEISSPNQASEMVVFYGNRRASNTATALWMRGKDTMEYDNRINNGAGDSFGVAIDQRGNRVDPTRDGPNHVNVAPPEFIA